MSKLTQEQKNFLIKKLYQHKIIKFGEFTLKSGIQSPIYFDLRSLISVPELFRLTTQLLTQVAEKLDFDLVCGVPYGALSFASLVAFNTQKPMIIKRKDVKEYGTKKNIEGLFTPGSTCLLIEDVSTTGSSCIEVITALETEQLKARDIVLIMDYGKAGNNLRNQGYQVHALFTFTDVVNYFERTEFISNPIKGQLNAFAQTITN